MCVSMDGCLHYFSFGAVMNKAPVNVWMGICGR